MIFHPKFVADGVCPDTGIRLHRGRPNHRDNGIHGTIQYLPIPCHRCVGVTPNVGTSSVCSTNQKPGTSAGLFLCECTSALSNIADRVLDRVVFCFEYIGERALYTAGERVGILT